MEITPELAIVIAGIISAMASIIVSVITSKSQTNLIVYRLGQLEEKVNAHNKLDVRMVALEESNKLLKEQVKTLLAQLKGGDSK